MFTPNRREFLFEGRRVRWNTAKVPDTIRDGGSTGAADAHVRDGADRPALT